MTTRVDSWVVHLTATAEADLEDIIKWTVEWFGGKQAAVYVETLALAIDGLASGPTTTGVKKVAAIPEGLFTLHVARNGRKGRHVVLFRIAAERAHPQIEVLRVLHDSMDLPRHALRAVRGL